MSNPATVRTAIAYRCPTGSTLVRVNIGGVIHDLTQEQALEVASEMTAAVVEIERSRPLPSLAEWCASEGLVCD